MSLQRNKRFKKNYDKLFKDDPEAANLFLLLCELADKKGKVLTDEAELARLMAERFENPRGVPAMKNQGYIPGGGFMVARRIFASDVWLKDPLYLKLWLWICGKANWENREKNGHIYRRGELVTSYSEIIKALTYFQNRQRIAPTIKKVRVMLEWLVNQGMIRVEPLQGKGQKTQNSHLPEHGRTWADTTALTRAYLGIKIIVVNYDTYQDSENYKDRDKGRDLSEQGHDNNKGQNNKGQNPPDFFSLRQRYPDQHLIDQCFAAITSTRKSGKVANSVLLAQLQKWERYPVEQVEAGIRLYLQKDYAAEGKGEKYLLGIIRNQKLDQEPKKSSSGSSLLDRYYAANTD